MLMPRHASHLIESLSCLFETSTKIWGVDRLMYPEVQARRPRKWLHNRALKTRHASECAQAKRPMGGVSRSLT